MAQNNVALGGLKCPAEADEASPLIAVRRLLLALAPHDCISLTQDCLTIRPATGTGFTISLLRGPGSWIVFFDGWHDEFPDLEMVLALIRQALSGEVRLRVDRMGQKPWRWTVERRLGDATWVALYSNAVFMLGRGQANHTVIYRNSYQNEGREAPLAVRLALKQVG